MAPAARRRFRVTPLAVALIEDPIDFLSAEHARQLVLLSHLDRLAQRPGARGACGLAGLLLHWLDQELPLHRADEALSLHPRLRAHDRAGVLGRLAQAQAQAQDGRGLARVVAGLRRLGGQRTAPVGFAPEAAAFVRQLRTGIAVEEAQVTPLSRAVLTPAALADIAAEMRDRRAAHPA